MLNITAAQLPKSIVNACSRALMSRSCPAALGRQASDTLPTELPESRRRGDVERLPNMPAGRSQIASVLQQMRSITAAMTPRNKPQSGNADGFVVA